MDSKSLLIQDFLPIKDCIRSHISRYAWTQGIQTFFLEQVPFSFGTGQQFSKLILDFIQLSMKGLHFHDYHIFELGAGLGFLGNNTVRLSQHYEGAPFNQLKYTCTDGSQDLVDYYQKHNGKVSFSHLDLTDWNTRINADMIVLSYVLDSLPFFRFKCVQGELFYLSIASSIPTDSVCLDYRTTPPTVMDAYSIHRYVKDSDCDDYYINRQIVSHLEEQEEWHLFEPSLLGLDESSYEEVLQFVVATQLKDNVPFNYSFEMSKLMAQFSQSLGEEGVVLIHDFGYFEPQSNWTGTYGAISFQAVFFPQIEYWAQHYGFSMFNTTYPSGKSQFCMLYRGNRYGQLEASFQRSFGSYEYGLLETKVEDLVRSQPLLANETDVASFFEPLPSYSLSDYFLLSNLSLYLIDQDHYDLALMYLNRSLEGYQMMALSSYYLKGVLYRKMGDMERATFYLQQGLESVPEYPYFHLELALIALDNHQYDDYMLHVSKGIKVVDLAEQMPFFEHIIRILIIKKESAQLVHYIGFLKQLIEVHSDLNFSKEFLPIWAQLIRDIK